jgi:hypothetical protein
MDILNWIYLVKNKFTRTTVENPATDLVVLGADVSYAKRGDKYQNYAVPAKDFVNSLEAADTGFYTIDIDAVSTLTVTTRKGVIEFTNLDLVVPTPSFATSINFNLVYSELPTVPDPDATYIQTSLYYNPASNADKFIPYVLSTGFLTNSVNFQIYNASPTAAGVDQGQGAFYLYYEIYGF